MTTIPWNMKQADGGYLLCLLGTKDELARARYWLSHHVRHDYRIGPINKDETGPYSMAVYMDDDQDAMLFKLTWANSSEETFCSFCFP